MLKKSRPKNTLKSKSITKKYPGNDIDVHNGMALDKEEIMKQEIMEVLENIMKEQKMSIKVV